VVKSLVSCIPLIWGPMKVQNKKLEHFQFFATVFTGKIYIDHYYTMHPEVSLPVVLYKEENLVYHKEGRI
jgi:hypothetical protein